MSELLAILYHPNIKWHARNLSVGTAQYIAAVIAYTYNKFLSRTDNRLLNRLLLYVAKAYMWLYKHNLFDTKFILQLYNGIVHTVNRLSFV